MQKLLLFIYLTLFSFQLSAQEYLTKVRHYNLEKGLETRDIRYIIKDSRGFMWFTSENGAYRFDGYEFKNYKQRKNSNEPYVIENIIEDSEQNIWFEHPLLGANKIDLSILPAGKDNLVSFNDFFKNRYPHPSDELLRIKFKAPNFISLLYKNGAIYEYKNERFTKIFQLNNLPYFKDKKNRIPRIQLLPLDDGSYLLAFKNQSLIITSNGQVSSQETLPVPTFDLAKDSQGRIWYRYYDYIAFKENKDAPLIEHPISRTELTRGNWLNSNSSFSSDFVLFSNDSSIYDFTLYDINEDKEINITPFGIPKMNISPYSYFIESKNSIWLTTHEGIYHIQLIKNAFQNFLQGKSTRKITKTQNGDILVAADQGLHKIPSSRKSSKIINYKQWVGGRDIFWENNNELWLGRHFTKIEKINLSKLESILYQFDSNINYSKDVNFIQRDKKTQQLWMGTTVGLYRYDVEQDSFLFFRHHEEFNDFNFVQNYQFFENEELILIATSRGILEFDPQHGTKKYFSTKNNTLPYDNIVFIHEDKKDGTFWLGTNMGGLIHWDKKNGTAETYTIQDGLSNDLIYAVYEDADGFLWLPSNQGLMQFDKNTKEVITYTTQDGLPHDEFNYYSHFQDEEGTLYFGGLNGITIFHPKDLKVKSKNAPLQFTDFEIYDPKQGKTTSLWNEFLHNKSITLQPSQKYFRLTLSLLDYKKPEANQFFYNIKGIENDWTPIDGNVLEINDLPYGNFNLKIKAKDSNNFWSNEILEVPIKVQRPIYMKWWFILASILLSAGLIRLIILWRTNSLNKEKEKLEVEVAKRTEKIEADKKVIEQQAAELKKLDEVKTQFFTNVTHELRTPLTLIIGPLKQLLRTNTLDEKTIRTLSTIAQNGEQLKNLVEEILDLSRYDANKLEVNKSSVHFLSELKKWVTGFDLQAQQRDIHFQLDYQLPIDIHLDIDNRKVEKIIVNLLSNAFKHTYAGGAITLEVFEKNNFIQLKVVDNGNGIHEADLKNIFKRFYQTKQSDSQLHGGLGIGLALSKELANLMKGKLSVESTLGQGSIFTLEILKEESEKILLPKEKGTEEILDTEEKLLQSIQTQSKNNILIVEDNVSMQSFIHELLYPFANVTIANNGKDALRILGRTPNNFNLIISDVMMPEMDGFTLLEKLRQDKEHQFIPVIMLTALGDINYKLKALRIGVDDYLVKPFEAEELVARVHTLVENIAMRKQELVPTNDNYKIETELPALESSDMKWLKELEEIAFEKITTPNFNIGQLAHAVALGERQLNRKLKKITGLTPGNYLKEIKLQKARQLLENKAYSTVAEISYLVGFSTPEYFSKVYKKRFGKLPKDYFK